MIRIPMPCFVASLALALGACAVDASAPSGDTPLYERTDLPEWTLAAEPSLRVGADEALPLARLADAALVDGRLVIADMGTNEVLFLDASGALTARQGGTGAGPGEYRGLIQLARRGDGVVAWDRNLERLTFLGADGRFERVLTLPAREGPPVPRMLGGAVGADHVLVWEWGLGMAGHAPVPTEVRDSNRYVLLNATTAETIWSTWAPTMEMMSLRQDPLATSSPVIYGRTWAVVSTPDGVVLGENGALDFRVRDGAGAERRVELPWEPPPAVAAEVALLRSGLRASADARRTRPGPVTRTPGGREVNRNELLADLSVRLVDALPARATLPAWSELDADADGNVWVRAYPRPGQDTIPWLILDRDLEPLARIRLPVDLGILDIGHDAMAVRKRGPFDEPIVEVWPLIKG